MIDEQDEQQPERDQDDLAHGVGRRRAGADVDFGGDGLGGRCVVGVSFMDFSRGLRGGRGTGRNGGPVAAERAVES